MKVLVTGAGGQLGSDVVSVLGGSVPPGATTDQLWSMPNGLVSVVGCDHGQLAVEDRAQVLGVCHEVRPDVIIHAAAWTAVDACEADPKRAYGINAMGTRFVAEGARAVGAHLCYISTDYVFDGMSKVPYVEWDEANPLSVYGKSKLAGEFECQGTASIIRTSWVNGVRGAGIAKTIMGLLRKDDGPLHFVSDQMGSPTFTADLAFAVAQIACNRIPGIFHITNAGTTTWHEFAQAIAEEITKDPKRIHAIQTSRLDPPRPARRPMNSVLENLAVRLLGHRLLPNWRDALSRFVVAVDAASHQNNGKAA